MKWQTVFGRSNTRIFCSYCGVKCCLLIQTLPPRIWGKLELTKLQSGPHEKLRRVFPGKNEFPVSTVKMMAGREANLSGRGKFSSGDCRRVVSKYLPVNGPWVVDQMSTRAYVSQFSSDGSLFVAAFQVIAFEGSQIRIYDVERGWKVRKNILARSLRWTITDTSFHWINGTISMLACHLLYILSTLDLQQKNLLQTSLFGTDAALSPKASLWGS